jgi:hypothetical protein
MTFIDRARAFIGLADPLPKWPPDRLSLALQGGGSFGAFTWGVLDRLLQEPGIDFDAISGASAGAVNAVLMAAGMVDGGAEEARARLTQFWRRMSRAAALLPKPVESPFGAGFDLAIRSMSPYQFNPFNLNPLREALLASVDFERLRSRSAIKLLLGATRVSDGRLRILTNSELTVEAVLASACLPLLIIRLKSTARLIGTGLCGQPPTDSAHSRLRMRARAHSPGHADQVGSAAQDGARYCQAHRADPIQRNAQQRTGDPQIREDDRGDREVTAAAHRPYFGRRGIRGSGGRECGQSQLGIPRAPARQRPRRRRPLAQTGHASGAIHPPAGPGGFVSQIEFRPRALASAF